MNHPIPLPLLHTRGPGKLMLSSSSYRAKKGPASKGRAYRARIAGRKIVDVKHVVGIGRVERTARGKLVLPRPTIRCFMPRDFRPKAIENAADALEYTIPIKVTTKTTKAQAEALNAMYTPLTGRYLAAYIDMRARERARKASAAK